MWRIADKLGTAWFEIGQDELEKAFPPHLNAALFVESFGMTGDDFSSSVWWEACRLETVATKSGSHVGLCNHHLQPTVNCAIYLSSLLTATFKLFTHKEVAGFGRILPFNTLTSAHSQRQELRPRSFDIEQIYHFRHTLMTDFSSYWTKTHLISGYNPFTQQSFNNIRLHQRQRPPRW